MLPLHRLWLMYRLSLSEFEATRQIQILDEIVCVLSSCLSLKERYAFHPFFSQL